MSDFFSKNRMRLVAGGVVLVLGVVLNSLMNETSTPESAGPAPSATHDQDAAPHDAAAPSQTTALADGDVPEMLMPPPFGERGIAPLAPGETPPSQTAAYCDDSNWKKVDVIVGRTESGEFRVDEATWNRTGLGSKAGLANWMSLCHENGSTIEIVAADSGRTLAIYDPSSGLTAL